MQAPCAARPSASTCGCATGATKPIAFGFWCRRSMRCSSPPAGRDSFWTNRCSEAGATRTQLPPTSASIGIPPAACTGSTCSAWSRRASIESTPSPAGLSLFFAKRMDCRLSPAMAGRCWISTRNALPDVFAKKLERASERDLGRRRLIVGTRVAVEPVPARIDVDRYVGPRLPDLLDIAERDAGIDVAEMQHGRHLRNLVCAGDDLAAVISDRASGAAQPCCRVERQRTTPAISHHADLAERLDAIDRGLHVEQAVFDRDLGAQGMSGSDAGRVVAELGARFGAIGQAWHDGCIS